MNLTALDYVVVAVAAISGTGLTLPVSSVSGVVVSHLAAVPRHVLNRAQTQEVWMETQLQVDSMYLGHTGQRRGWVSSCRAAGGETRHLRTDRWKEGWTHHHCRAVGVALYEKLFKNSSEEDTPLST